MDQSKKMTTTDIKDNPLKGLFGSNVYFLLSIAMAIPIFIAINAYLEPLIHDSEAVSFAATTCFILCLFAGRYLCQFWTSTLTFLPKPQILGMCLIIVACMIGFMIAGFWSTRLTSLSLLLFFLSLVIMGFDTGILIKVVHAVTQNQLKTAQSLAAHSKSELNLLQSQLSPHFLFNTLNNMYGISISDHQKIPGLLLKLSELLRYSVYEATEMYVPLKEEMNYINNYIEFEKIRIGDRLVLTTDIEEITDTHIKIAPMLLIVFIENAFKHSKNTSEEKIFIDIKLRTWGSSILFSIKNSYQKQEELNGLLQKSGGLGLANVGKRLTLLYPDAYSIDIKNETAHYNVNLQLKMKYDV